MFRSILYATDLGLYAPYVLQHAMTLARTYQSELHVVHAVEPMGLFAESVLQTYLDEKAMEELRSEGFSRVLASIEQRVLEGFRDELGELQEDTDVIRNVRVVQGDPARVILEEARKIGADLLVVGSHSHGGAQDTAMGRTALRVLQLAEIPVYLVPMLQHRSRPEL
ncbi:MAG TPA: universal stress protein [Pseudomonas sp.]|nr:universal stress protein [Pseudomonas sp.]